MHVLSSAKNLIYRANRSRKEKVRGEYGRENDQNSFHKNNPHGNNCGCAFIYCFISSLETYSAYRALHIREYRGIRPFDDPDFSASFHVAHDGYSLVKYLGNSCAVTGRKRIDL